MHLAQDNHRYKYRQMMSIENNPVEKDPGVRTDEKWDMVQQCVFAAQKTNCILCCIKRSVAKQVEGCDSALLYRSLETP